MSTITKKDLALLVSQSTACKKNLAAKMVDSLFVAMRDSLIEGNRIEIRGFGVFQVKDTRPKPAARNPRTGEIIYVPARRKTHFKPGRLLKEALHQTREEGGVVPPAADSSPADTASGVASAYSVTDNRDDDDDD
ncbi:MAG: HU family DNA-binding protein [Candidatus Latescibacterota bacterium]